MGSGLQATTAPEWRPLRLARLIGKMAPLSEGLHPTWRLMFTGVVVARPCVSPRSAVASNGIVADDEQVARASWNQRKHYTAPGVVMLTPKPLCYLLGEPRFCMFSAKGSEFTPRCFVSCHLSLPLSAVDRNATEYPTDTAEVKVPNQELGSEG
jgi:hypothetical protein